MTAESPPGQLLRLKSHATVAELWDALTRTESLELWLAKSIHPTSAAAGSMTLCDSHLYEEMELKVTACETAKRLEFSVLQPSELVHRAHIELAQLEGDEEERRSVMRVRLEGQQQKAEVTSQRRQLSVWQTSLAALRHVAESNSNTATEGTRFSIHVDGPAISRVQLREHYRTGAGLASWLSAGGVLGPPGSAFELLLRNGERWTGRVLNDNLSSEVLLSCDNWQGLLELRARPLAGDRMRYGLQGFTKNLASEATEELQERLNQALQRLLEQLNHAA